MNLNFIKIHWTHKVRIQRLYQEGFTDEEIAIMYHLPWSAIKRITYHLKGVSNDIYRVS